MNTFGNQIVHFKITSHGSENLNQYLEVSDNENITYFLT